MKMKTWEKIYWGIIIALITLAVIGYSIDPTIFKISDGNAERVGTWTELIVGLFLFYIVFLGLIWLIIRYFVNERERE